MTLFPIYPRYPYLKGRLTDVVIGESAKNREAHLRAAGALVVSQEGLAREMAQVGAEAARAADSIEALADRFDWRLAEVMWQMEQQNSALQDILKVLESPLDTQARELKRRAEEAYANGWFDEALQDFLESEKKNPYDFSVHQYLANIYLFRKNDGAKAVEYAEKAAKFAEPKSRYHAAYALLHLARAHSLMGEARKAYDATARAVALSPAFVEAQYQHAIHCAIIGEPDQALEHLDKAFEKNCYYLSKAASDPGFATMGERLQAYIEDMRAEAEAWAQDEIEVARKAIEKAQSCGAGANGTTDLAPAIQQLDNARRNARLGGVLDSCVAAQAAMDAQRLAWHGAIASLTRRINDTEKRIAEIKGTCEAQAKRLGGLGMGCAIYVASVIFCAALSTLAAFLPALRPFSWPLPLVLPIVATFLIRWGALRGNRRHCNREVEPLESSLEQLKAAAREAQQALKSSET